MSLILADLPEHTRTIAKLSAVADLPPAEAEALLGLKVTVLEFERGADIVREHERPAYSCLLLSGLVARYKMSPDGGRQIMSFHIAGDIPDLQSLHLQRLDHSLGVLRFARVATIRHDDLRRVIYSSPTLCHLLWRETLIDAAVHREWLMVVGRLPARARIAHLFSEMLMKHQAAGLTAGPRFGLHLTQAELADALGITSVHVNRVLQELRGEGLIGLDRGDLTIVNLERLHEVAAFDPTYLHLAVGKPKRPASLVGV